MSVFRVKLNNNKQGLLDLDPSTASSGGVTGQGLGGQMQPSIQRGVYIMGPNLINRLLSDGDTFTDCNYWKRFAFPQVPLEEAFIEVVTDDGSVFSDVPGENTFPASFLPGAASDGVLVGGDTFTDTGMSLDIVSTYGGPAVFTQIKNTDATDACIVRLNGTTTFTLEAASTQIFNAGDLQVTKIEFDNSASGAADVDKVEVLLSIRSVCTS